jgi:hypothetical protein
VTIYEAISEQLEHLLLAAGVSWRVAVTPPPGYPGPCVSLERVRIRPGDRSSLTEYPRVELDVTATGLDMAGAETAYEIIAALADASWTSTRFTSLHGRLAHWQMEREEGARHERFVVTGTIEYQVEQIEE